MAKRTAGPPPAYTPEDALKLEHPGNVSSVRPVHPSAFKPPSTAVVDGVFVFLEAEEVGIIENGSAAALLMSNPLAVSRKVMTFDEAVSIYTEAFNDGKIKILPPRAYPIGRGTNINPIMVSPIRPQRSSAAEASSAGKRKADNENLTVSKRGRCDPANTIKTTTLADILARMDDVQRSSNDHSENLNLLVAATQDLSDTSGELTKIVDGFMTTQERTMERFTEVHEKENDLLKIMTQVLSECRKSHGEKLDGLTRSTQAISSLSEAHAKTLDALLVAAQTLPAVNAQAIDALTLAYNTSNANHIEKLDALTETSVKLSASNEALSKKIDALTTMITTITTSADTHAQNLDTQLAHFEERLVKRMDTVHDAGLATIESRLLSVIEAFESRLIRSVAASDDKTL